jgi:hypothetical protein
MQQLVRIQRKIISIMEGCLDCRDRFAARFAPSSPAFLQFVAFRFFPEVLVSYFTTTPPHLPQQEPDMHDHADAPQRQGGHP